MSNDNNNPVNPGGAYYPPFGYPYYPPAPAPAPEAAPPQQPAYWPHPPMWYPQMMPGFPPMGYPMPPQAMAAAQPSHHAQPAFDWNQQAQSMVENMMGEQAGILKNIIGTVGMDDKEFWKGAMIGAAVTLLLTNESVRNMLLQTVANTGDLLKTGGAKVKDGVKSGAESLKETATTSSTIFRDTLKAGKEGFNESVERHRQQGQPADEEPQNEQQS
ncbi:hypothetical protein B4923_14580 [Brenneria roseae subsp. americana]|uniref:YtxH domain-containing protein n=1 Tax=Brenneria roseae subsp. americana TaxID=1508507 RepID=A0A2U1TNY6_9GAMM|nr:YtxH domain-containing protein [Brenneria roseae]PWC11117.1 hypothetical protein B4923_14580 [Brenneria roseae subsp. americana]